MPECIIGSRYNKGKPELSMVLEANKALEGLAKVLMNGRDKYSRGNWLKGLEHMGIVDCLVRHLMAHVSGDNTDAESGLPHVDHVLANALFLSQMYHTRPDLDNRVVIPSQAPEVSEQARALVERIDSLTNSILQS